MRFVSATSAAFCRVSHLLPPATGVCAECYHRQPVGGCSADAAHLPGLCLCGRAVAISSSALRGNWLVSETQTSMAASSNVQHLRVVPQQASGARHRAAPGPVAAGCRSAMGVAHCRTALCCAVLCRYDGQVFVKPPKVLTRDRLLSSYQVKPVLAKLRQTLLGAGVVLLTSAVLLTGLIQTGTDEYGVYGEVMCHNCDANTCIVCQRREHMQCNCDPWALHCAPQLCLFNIISAIGWRCCACAEVVKS